MIDILLNKKRRIRRKMHIRKKITGTASVPRLSVFKSNKYLYVQAINDDTGMTLASASSFVLDKGKSKLNIKTAEKVGTDIAKKLADIKISEVVFDRNGFLYTGKIKAFADSARKSGLKF